MYLKITCTYYHPRLCACHIESFIGPFQGTVVDQVGSSFEESLRSLWVIHKIEVVFDATSWERHPSTTSPNEFATKIQQAITSKGQEQFI